MSSRHRAAQSLAARVGPDYAPCGRAYMAGVSFRCWRNACASTYIGFNIMTICNGKSCMSTTARLAFMVSAALVLAGQAPGQSADVTYERLLNAPARRRRMAVGIL